MKKKIALTLAFAMMLMSFSAFAQQQTITMRVEDIDSNLFYDTDLSFNEGDLLIDVLTATLDENDIDYVKEAGQYGAYISSIGGDTAGTFGGWDGWVYYVNGASPTVSMADYVLKAGDSILVCYADPHGTPATYMPELKTMRDENGMVTMSLAATVMQYDENYNPLGEVSIPMEGVSVVLDGTLYTTDGQGMISLSADDSEKGEVSVSISKYDEAGKPLVVRFAPDFTVDLDMVEYSPIVFPDVPEGEWYYDFVYNLVARGAIGGLPDGTFAPLKTITNGEVLKILASLSGDELEPAVEGEHWARSFDDWAVSTAVIAQPMTDEQLYAAITREQLAVMLVNYNLIVMGTALPQTEEAPAFLDEADISDEAAESVYLLQKAGVIQGNDKGEFMPNNSASRAEFCKMVDVLLSFETVE